ncbi:MAG: elongation factor G [Pirellulales bacterium]|nr:elongation factor G [Pirellulales bacterium]
MDLYKLRNLGISAHIDSGKTTLSERILFYTGRIHKIEDVHGAGAGATMDHMELEKERGITITSAATSIDWKGYRINLIDTPGHVDFTVEVERSLRVLDGAILVLCAVGGVQAQSLTVDRQMRRYHVPRLAFINKMDRVGADHENVCRQIREKLDDDAILMQIPIGRERSFQGMIDLVRMRAFYFDGPQGQDVREEVIPRELEDEAAAARQRMLEALSLYSDELMELLLSEEDVPEELIHSVTRNAALGQDMTPVFLGSAFRNKGVQPLLDAITRYLPSPVEHDLFAQEYENSENKIPLMPDPARPFVGMAFKIVDDEYGQLTFMRIYQGTIRKGGQYYNQRTSQRERFSRILRMHADRRQEIPQASAGDIVAVLGIDAASGDTYAADPKFCTLESIFVAEPVIKMSIAPVKRDCADRLGKALARFCKEDPTFQRMHDPETQETVIAGMGELHLEIYVERIRREYQVDVQVGPPKVSYRETPTQPAQFNFKHKKQTGGSGQYAHIEGIFRPLTDAEMAETEENLVFEDHVTGGRIPKHFIPAIQKGFQAMMQKGPVAGFPVVRLHVDLNDGSYHEVDSSEMAFTICAQNCFRETFQKMKPVLLEPIMAVEIECPESFQGNVSGNISGRRGVITSTNVYLGISKIYAEVPLAEMFGYATDLRSLTQGQGTFTMELSGYKPVPVVLQGKIIEERRHKMQPV